MNRRDFIKKMAVTAGSISPLLTMSGLSLVGSNALAASSVPTDGYKAIVLINLDGGNDAMNTFPPIGASAYADYADIRGNLAVQNVDLSENEFYQFDAKGHYTVASGGTSGNLQPYWPNDHEGLGSEANLAGQYTIGSYHTKDENGNKTGLGIHAYMPEIAALYDNKRLSVVSNTGILVAPTTKDTIENGSVKLPPFLFSHLHQARAVASLSSDVYAKTGWAGRLADEWDIQNILGLNLSFTGGMGLFNGTKTNGLRLSAAGVDKFHGAPNTHELLNNIANISESNQFKRLYNKKMDDVAKYADVINTLWVTAPDFSTFDAKNSYGEALFDTGGDNLPYREKLGMRTHHGLSGSMFDALKQTAKMLKVTKDSGNHRQIFNISESGYDFHGGHLEAHTKKLRALSMAVSDFYKALEEMGMQNEVLVVLTSEFGRTMKSNPDGTDHGWGGHSFMLCGDDTFNGGQVFGEVMDDLKLDGVNAYTNRARIIPTTSMEQMMAPALKWFGVEEATMAHVLPNLTNFRTSADIESAYLQGVFTV